MSCRVGNASWVKNMLSQADLHGSITQPLVHATMQGMAAAVRAGGEVSTEYPAVVACLLGFGLDANSCPEEGAADAGTTALSLCWELEKGLPDGEAGAALRAAVSKAEASLVGAGAYGAGQ